jgi:hypothetical protein
MLLLLLASLLPSPAFAKTLAVETLPEDPKTCFARLSERLADDAFDGRGVGTAANDAAAEMIRGWFVAGGLEQPKKGWTQSFPVRTGVRFGVGNQLDGAALETDWTPLGFSANGAFTGELVFAGYGIRATDLGYDDYAGLDVKGKVVLAMRYEPGENDDASPFEGKRPTRYSDLRTKAIVAREAGAKALILVSPASTPDEPDRLPPLKVLGPVSDAGLPVLQVSRALAERWLGSPLATVQAEIDRTMKPASRSLTGTKVSGRTDLVPTTATTGNVLGVIPGVGALASEVVVLGAHYDHLGHGGHGSLRPDSTEIHNGADDNASGVAAITCAAAALRKSSGAGSARTVVVAAFSAEEIGLGGSAWYVANPLFPLEKTVAMVNLDMVGRLREGKLALLGTDSSLAWAGMVDAAAKDIPSLKPSLGGDGYGPSDHASFYTAGIPVAHLFTGAHDEYHTPADDFPTLNLDGGADLVRFTAALIGEVRTSARPSFVRSTTSAPTMGDSRGYGAYFGSVPDYTAMESASGGVKLADTRPGSPAARAGLLKGDIIIGMAGVSVQNLYDMTFVLREHKPGESIEVVVKRDGKELRLLATLGTRPAQSESHARPAPQHASFKVESSLATPRKGDRWSPGAGKPVPELIRPEETHLADLRRLTWGGENAEAYWGPDGRTLSFQRTMPEGGCDAQYLYNLDSGEVNLASSGKGRTTCGYLDYPEGKTLLYATTEATSPECPKKPDYSKGYVWPVYPEFDIVRDDLKGNRTPIIASPAYDAEATVCFKDGRILFTSTRNGDLDLYVAEPDGSDPKQLTDTPGYDGGAFFTPDCKQIVFRASRPEGAALEEYQSLLKEGLVRPSKLEIFVMNADGSKPRQLTSHGVGSFAPYPTPDGRGVLYSTNRGDNPREFDIWFVDWKGKEERITTSAGFDGFPMFSPDGKWIVFSSNRATEAGKTDTDLYIARWVR